MRFALTAWLWPALLTGRRTPSGTGSAYVVYANLETVPALAAAAAVTERIGLTAAILIGPYLVAGLGAV